VSDAHAWGRGREPEWVLQPSRRPDACHSAGAAAGFRASAAVAAVEGGTGDPRLGSDRPALQPAGRHLCLEAGWKLPVPQPVGVLLDQLWVK